MKLLYLLISLVYESLTISHYKTLVSKLKQTFINKTASKITLIMLVKTPNVMTSMNVCTHEMLTP